jgi:cobalt/nickel transport protein
VKTPIIFLLILVVLLVPFIINENAEWGGADAQAEVAISEFTGGTYEPWFSPIWEPPSGEIESLLFSLQAALGAIIVGYFIGYHKGKNSVEEVQAR